MRIVNIISSFIDMFRKKKNPHRHNHKEGRKNRGLKAREEGMVNRNNPTTSPITAEIASHHQVPITVNNLLLSTTLNQEKKHLLGEDADPLLVTTENMGFIGVFDGMGGSGATEYTLHDGTKRTGAYVASRKVCESLQNFITETQNNLISM